MTFEPSSRMAAILASSRNDPAVDRFRETVGTRVLSMLTPPEPKATILEAFRAPPRTTVVREYIVSPLSFVSAIIVGALVGGMLVMLRSGEGGQGDVPEATMDECENKRCNVTDGCTP